MFRRKMSGGISRAMNGPIPVLNKAVRLRWKSGFIGRERNANGREKHQV